MPRTNVPVPGVVAGVSGGAMTESHEQVYRRLIYRQAFGGAMVQSQELMQRCLTDL